MSSSPGYLAVSGIEVANNARTAAYLEAGLASPQFEIIYGDEVCPELTDLAFPLDVCPGLSSASADQFYADPRPAWRAPLTGLPPVNAGVLWDRSGWVQGVGQTPVSGAGMIFPNPGQVPLRVRVSMSVLNVGASCETGDVCRVINVGTAQVAWIGMTLERTGGNYVLRMHGRTPAGSSLSGPLGATIPIVGPEDLWLDVLFSSVAMIANLYGSDPAVAGAPLIATRSYAYSSDASGTWYTDTGQTEAQSFAAVTEVGLLALSQAFALPTDIVLTEIDVLPGEPCTATGSSYPGSGAWPGVNVYPGMYGVFVNPGVDNAPWIDPAQPASFGFMGLFLDDLTGWDTTETRSLDASASGRGGILGPAQSPPRHLTAKGWLIATDCAAMEYARRWLADVLAGELCPGCDGLYADILPLCGAQDGAGLRRLYDVGLEGLALDTSDVNSCCYVTPVEFTLAIADPFIYTLPVTVIDHQVLAPLAPDSPAVPFETWLFSSPDQICVNLADEGLGTDAAIVTLYGGTSGISGGLVFRSQGHYPQASLFPGACVYPASGSPQWDIDVCPFVFSISIGPGETFTVDNSRERVDWQLSDGTVLAGSPRLALDSGQVVQWIDTCDGADAQVCIQASANCTCDTSAAVSVATQHHER